MQSYLCSSVLYSSWNLSFTRMLSMQDRATQTDFLVRAHQSLGVMMREHSSMGYIRAVSTFLPPSVLQPLSTPNFHTSIYTSISRSNEHLIQLPTKRKDQDSHLLSIRLDLSPRTNSSRHFTNYYVSLLSFGVLYHLPSSLL